MQIEQAAVIPLIIAMTQILKPFKQVYKYTPLLVFVISILGTVMVNLYNLNSVVFETMARFDILRFFIECVFTAVATWLSASKLYDLVIGDRKRNNDLEALAARTESNAL